MKSALPETNLAAWGRNRQILRILKRTWSLARYWKQAWHGPRCRLLAHLGEKLRLLAHVQSPLHVVRSWRNYLTSGFVWLLCKCYFVRKWAAKKCPKIALIDFSNSIHECPTEFQLIEEMHSKVAVRSLKTDPLEILPLSLYLLDLNEATPAMYG